ncbi:MAG: hypothetical protein GXY85_10835 [Candidatus Brocadiaceae bacterium]|nr:hypothetical protein [Candidatus Brocadiaceae bacterium]
MPNTEIAWWLEWTMGSIAIIVIMLVCIAFRRDRAPYAIFAGALLLACALYACGWGNEDPIWSVVLFLEVSAAGMVGYALFRWKRMGYGPAVAAIAGIADSLIVFPFLRIVFPFLRIVFPFLSLFGRPMTMVHGYWVLYLMPASVVTALFLLLIAAGMRLLVAALRRAGNAALRRAGKHLDQPATRTEEAEADRQLVLAMVAEGKVSTQEAAQLLEALGGHEPPGDRLPIRSGTLASVVGALLIVVGFMLPWNHVSIEVKGPMAASVSAYQMGYNVGFLGWLILCLGLLPALLACITALDRHLRQGMIRLLLSALGLAFTVSMIVTIWMHGYFLTLGLYFTVLGLLIQMVSALVESGLLRPRPAVG